MGTPPFNYVSGGFGNRRRVNSDGTVTIICRYCEKVISKEMFKGFSTATCAVCYGELERGKRPEELMAAQLENEREEAADVYNDLGMGGFKARGVVPRIKELVEKVRIIATKRRRGPLLSKKDDL